MQGNDIAYETYAALNADVRAAMEFRQGEEMPAEQRCVL